MSVTFKKRLFGADPDIEVIKEFERLGTGGELKYIGEDPVTNEPLTEVNPTYEKYELGEKTPFSRMWCAVSVNEWRKEAWGKYKGEKIYRNSIGEWYYFIDEDEAQQKVIGDDKESERLVFSVNELTDDSYSTPLEPLQISGESGKIKFQKQLSVNPLMKPEAGIKSVRVKTQGAIGAIISATIEFTVHNRYDFENIFLPFFMKPGAIVCLDYGWSDVPLYNIVSQIKEKDIDMTEFDRFIYHPNLGYLANNYGKVRTVIGNVVSYDATMTAEGGFDCSIEIVSRNAGLLEKRLDGNLQNLFVNSINDILALLFSKSRGLDNHFSFAHIYKSLTTAEPENTDLIAKRFISELSDTRNSTVDPKTGVRVFDTGLLPPTAVKRGIYHQDMSPNKSLREGPRKPSLKDSKDDAKALTQKIVTDDVLKTEVTYISYGLFEDLFLNNFARGVIVGKKEIDSRRKEKVVEKQFFFKPGEDFENNFDTRDVFVRWSKHFRSYQEAKLDPNEALPIFLIPDNWDISYNSNKLKGFDSTDSYVDFNTNTETSTTGKHPQYKGINVMPLREVFISVGIISAAFKSADTINDAISYIYDELNSASSNVWNLRIQSNDASSTVSARDVNLLPIQQQKLIFDVTGPKSIVSGVDLKYSTPKDGLSSILAIGSLNGPQSFRNLDLSQFSFLNLLNRPMSGIAEDPPRLPHVRPLPSQGDINRLTTEEQGLTLSLTGLTEFVNSWDAGVEQVDNKKEKKSKNQEKLNFYYDQITKDYNLEEEEKPLGETTNEATPNKAYQYKIKNLDFYDSERSLFKLLMREESIDGDGEGTISPILPIELTLTIYGNTYLQVGDRFTINYLPEFYKDRVNFQIVGIEDTVDTNGWSTVYQTVMRVDPSKKSIVTGNKGIFKRQRTYAQNPEKNPMDKLTSSVRLFDDLPAKVRASVKAITQHHELLPDLNENEKIRKFRKRSNLTLRCMKITVAEPDAWKNIITKTQISNEQLGIPTGGSDPYADHAEKDDLFVDEEVVQTNIVSTFTSGIRAMYDLKDRREVAYAYAVRNAMIGEHSPLDFKKIKPKFLVGHDKQLDLEEEIRNMGDSYMLIQLDNKSSALDVRITSEVDGPDITDVHKPTKTYGGIDSVDFKLNKDLKEFWDKKEYDNLREELGENLRYTDGQINDAGSYYKATVNTLVRRFHMRLDEKFTSEKNKNNEQTMTCFFNDTKLRSFKAISIPDHCFRKNPGWGRLRLYSLILQYYNFYIKAVGPKDSKGNIITLSDEG